MPGKARAGKQKTHKGTRKRVKLSSDKKSVSVQAAAKSHRLDPKSKRQKNLGGKRYKLTGKVAKNMKVLLSS